MDQRAKAEHDLRVIRSLMERATVYRAISAPTALLGGLLRPRRRCRHLLEQPGRRPDSRPDHSRPRLCHRLDRRARPYPGREYLLYLARGSKKPPSLYLLRNEAGPARNRSLPARSDCLYQLVLSTGYLGGSRTGSGRGLGRLLRPGAAFHLVVCAAFPECAGLGVPALRAGHTGWPTW